MQSVDIAILGGGISGLTAAYLLRDQDACVLEQQSWIGGRTLSEPLADGVWANYGAQVLTADKTRTEQLATDLGCDLVSVAWLHSFERAKSALGRDGFSRADQESVYRIIERLEAEQRHPRDPSAAELDRQTFAEWLGPVSDRVAMFWETWTQGLICGSIIETSLYGALWLWGDQRTTAWSTEPVARHPRGNCVFAGGTNKLAQALASTLGDRLRTNTCVTKVRPEVGTYVVEVVDPTGSYSLRARRIVCSLPAPIAVLVMGWLPSWKQDCLGRVRYGRYISTPIAVVPPGAPGRSRDTYPARPCHPYTSTGFALKNPGDIDRQSSCFQSWISDGLARPIWDDPDESIKAEVARAFLARFPNLADRIGAIKVHRWRFGLPQYYPGRMRDAEALVSCVEGVHFCGDYTYAANLEGAVRSAERAAMEIRTALPSA